MDISSLVQTEVDRLRVENIYLRIIVKKYEAEIDVCLSTIKRLAFIDGVVMCDECGMLWPDNRHEHGAQKCKCSGYICGDCVDKVSEQLKWVTIPRKYKSYTCTLCSDVMTY